VAPAGSENEPESTTVFVPARTAKPRTSSSWLREPSRLSQRGSPLFKSILSTKMSVPAQKSRPDRVYNLRAFSNRVLINGGKVQVHVKRNDIPEPSAVIIPLQGLSGGDTE
jgi:hypothetical protein